MERRAPLRKEDMHVVGKLFGIRIVPREGLSPLAELYIEDDENYFYKTDFDVYWLKDLREVADVAVKAHWRDVAMKGEV